LFEKQQLSTTYPCCSFGICSFVDSTSAPRCQLGAWLCRGAACGDSHTRQCGAARPGLQNFPWRPPLLQVPLHSSITTSPNSLLPFSDNCNSEWPMQQPKKQLDYIVQQLCCSALCLEVQNPGRHSCAAKDFEKGICQPLLCLTVLTSITIVKLQVTVVCVKLLGLPALAHQTCV